MSSGTTSLDQLPINPQNNNSDSPPIQAVVTESIQNSNNNVKIQNYGQQLSNERNNETGSQVPPIDYTAQLTSALKEASAVGATVLPSRDIPQQTLSHLQDNQIKPDYVPPNTDNDYIGNIVDKEKIILENQKVKNQQDNLEYIYQSLQLPILVGILYFLFQLPVVRKNLLTFLPNLFNKDSSPKLSGYIFNSIMFSLFYVLIVKGLYYLQTHF